MNQPTILAIDQGTSGSKAIVFSKDGRILASYTEDYHIDHPKPAYVEIDPNALLQSVYSSAQGAILEYEKAGGSRENIQVAGISNQRESFLIWDAQGTALCPVVVWQCKRSVDYCRNLAEDRDFCAVLKKRTGLVPDPYFSGTKAAVLVQENQTVRDAIKTGNALFGTIDTWLAWNLTNGETYATDRTNASRTMLYDINSHKWDNEIVQRFGLSGMRLPEVRTSDAGFGFTDLNGLLPHTIPIGSMIGDSHAAAFGEGLFRKGEAKVTLGTGSSILMNVGSRRIESTNGMVSTICWSTADRTDYALEGIVVSCGSTINWLKNKLKLISSSREIDELSEQVESAEGVYVIPGFSGIGAPWWKLAAKASILGIEFGHDRRHIARAALESIPFQVTDVLRAMADDFGSELSSIKADGGITVSRFVLKGLADLSGCPVQVPAMKQASAWGAALMAGLHTGIYPNLETIDSVIGSMETDQLSGTVNSQMNERYRGWRSILEDY